MKLRSCRLYFGTTEIEEGTNESGCSSVTPARFDVFKYIQVLQLNLRSVHLHHLVGSCCIVQGVEVDFQPHWRHL